MKKLLIIAIIICAILAIYFIAEGIYYENKANKELYGRDLLDYKV